MGGHFDSDNLKKELALKEAIFNSEDVWSDVKKATSLNAEISSLKKQLSTYDNLLNSTKDNLDMAKMLIDADDEDLYTSLEEEYNHLLSLTDSFEVQTLLNDEFDSSNCYLEIHPGAGGTEACDWASMLLRMYTMFFDKFGFKYEIIDRQAGEEAGIKSVMVHVIGSFAYGYLKSEIGVHRLVRISPFDSNSRRHTSFAAVNITPEFDKVTDVEIKDEDVRIDVYRSSGCGGQGVNTTDSAVRVTHLPTGIVVTCQNERSQIKNKEIALNILKSKLYRLEVMKRNEEISSLKGNSNIDFGSQIRNYVLEPYSLVKDVRTNHESTSPEKVLNGDIYPFIEAYLRMKR